MSDWKDGHKSRCNPLCVDDCEGTSAPLFPECSGDGDVTDMNYMAEACQDKAFWKSKKAVSNALDQVLRYNLAVTNRGDPSSVPHCSCGSERQFEFQVLSQLLNSITEPTVDSLD
ncbi:hypothetical protein HPB50_000161 [Hyalomma asiaticum]|uniref:Uncharacterized protein n=1 Tax=Hyalomma asiaticum TaxID=266040 RepID=A0ACB7TCF1_HYAAI|nr:hypothetical protein HPB50_000161 [Hyalomma asiaticum]